MRNRSFATVPRRHLALVTNGKHSGMAPCLWHTGSERLDADIQEVRSSSDREALDRFHRRVSVMDANRRHRQINYQFSNPNSKAPSGDAVQLVALRDSGIVGTVQITYASTQDLGVDADFYRMREAAGDSHPSGTCILSRLLIEPDYRGSDLGRRMCVAAYRNALDANARTAFLRCNDPLVFYFAALGFKPYMGKSWHTQYGEVLPMKLDLLDEQYLEMIDSPFLPELRAWKQSLMPNVTITARGHDPETP
jgi:GNAT superfamily N-acetyltransferase